MNDIDTQASDWLPSESGMQLQDAAIIHLNFGSAETFLPGKAKIRGERPATTPAKYVVCALSGTPRVVEKLEQHVCSLR